MPLKVFYLDDEPDLLEMFSDLFSGPGVEITTCAEVETAMKLLREQDFDVVFLDYRLPGTTGDAIARQLAPAQIKALITGDLSVKMEVKFDAQFPKPYKREAIAEFLRSQLEAKEKNPV